MISFLFQSLTLGVCLHPQPSQQSQRGANNEAVALVSSTMNHPTNKQEIPSRLDYRHLLFALI